MGSYVLAASVTLTFSKEPRSLDLRKLSHNTPDIIFANVFRGLYRYGPDLKPLPVGQNDCQFNSEKTRLVCSVDKQLKFSDGTQITAKHFINTWTWLIANREIPLKRTEIFYAIKNAALIAQNVIPVSELGLKILNQESFEIIFEKPTPWFLHALASGYMSVLKEPSANPEVYSGAFIIKDWKRGHSLKLTPNRHSVTPAKASFLIRFVPSLTTQLRLFQKGASDFSPTVPTHLLDTYLKEPSFKKVPLLRFDHIAFSPTLRPYPELRKALALALDYSELQKLYHTDDEGAPGCPGYGGQKSDCYSFNVDAAKKSFANHQRNHSKFKVPLVLAYPSSAGMDVKRGMEWMQLQWQKHLGLSVKVAPMESSIFRKQIMSKNPPALFRKAMSLSFADCSALTNSFHSEAGVEVNSLQLKDTSFDQLGCQQALSYLKDQTLLIPLGKITYSALIRPKIQALDWNPLNQIVLDQITFPNASEKSQ